MLRIVIILAWPCLFAAPAFGQGSQRQAVAVSLQGTPIPGADVWACQAGSTPNYTAAPPCPLANIYSDPSLGSSFLIAQPLVSDGLGNYTYYATAGTYVEVITGANTTGYSSKIVLPCAPNSASSGCSGAAGNPGGSDTQLQINNQGQFGAVTGFGVNSSAIPTILSVPFSEAVKGPRPWVDATAYGADPSGATDSTTALTNAAAAACNGGSTLEIPPGNYALTQPQSPSTSPVIPIPCSHIHILGFGDQGTTQSEQPPQTKLVVATLGSNPNAAPVFAFKYPTNGGEITLENLQVSGYNQALSFYATSGVSLNNVCATAQASSLADNVPLKVTNVSWFRMTYGCLNSGGSSLPMALFTGEAPIASEASIDAFVQMEHVRGSGANLQYIQRVTASTSIPGNFVFNDVTPSGSSTDFLTVTNATGQMGQTAMPQFGPVFFLNSSLPGASGSGALINFNSSGSNLTGVHIYNSNGSSQANPLVAVRMSAGSLQDCEVRGGVGAVIEDSSGNLAGSCSLETRGGLDFVADSTISAASRLRSEITTGASPTPNLRFFASPDSRASYGIDAGQGFLFNDGTNNGFNASLAETVKGSVDVQFANLFAPTNVSGTATTGGTLPAGTYYPFVATTSNNCATVSTPSMAGAPVNLSGSNNAVSVTWSAPLQGVSTVNGYCVAIASSSANANAGLSYAGLFVSGASASSATITSVSGSMQFPMANAMSSVHRFTSNSLGINTTAPSYNLDVNGGARVAGSLSFGSSGALSMQASGSTLLFSNPFSAPGGTLTGDLLPDIANTRNLGSLSLPFDIVYAAQFKVPGTSTAEIIGNEGSCSASPIAPGVEVLCLGDATSHGPLLSDNGGAFYRLPETIASGTAALGTSAISSNTCASVVTASATGVATTDVITWSLSATATGYVPTTVPGLKIVAIPTSGNVNFYVCNETGGSITPSAETLNWSVIR